MVSKANMSSKKSFFSEGKSEMNQTDADFSGIDEALDDGEDPLTRKKGNPVMENLKSCFQEIGEEIKTYTSDKVETMAKYTKMVKQQIAPDHQSTMKSRNTMDMLNDDDFF